MPNPVYTRTIWPDDFPDAVIHSLLEIRNAHPDYPAAKAGSREAAFRLVIDLFDHTEARSELKHIVQGANPLLAAVSAIEATGFNAIPDALAVLVSDAIDADIETGEIRQINKVGHTKARGWHRFVTQAEFTGTVELGRNYVLVDDHIGFGGTLANLRGYIELHGGRVIAMTTLTETRDARKIALQKATLDMLLSKHGQELQQFWTEIFGFGLECLTELEANYLCRQSSIDKIRRRLAAAAEKASLEGLLPVELPGLET